MKPEKILTQIVTEFVSVLGTNLVGIYLHGSLAMGCYNSKSSDIDFLVVISDEIHTNKKKEIISRILKISNIAPEKGLEMSILLEKELLDFQYPTPFSLHYSVTHKERYENDPTYLCGDGLDPDLAAHINVVIERGQCLYGKPIASVFRPIPEKYYIYSLLNDLDGVEDNIAENPTYYILNLCRVLQYLQEKEIVSKSEGGNWALKTISDNQKDVVSKALLVYETSDQEIDFINDELVDFVKYMLSEIEAEYKLRSYAVGKKWGGW
ncbi:aminoglycoside adenylyltransferase domain-containing protein [Chloroflexota bacterium]